MGRKKERSIDGFSELPVHIMHIIFSLLPPLSLAVVSTISKSWWRAHVSFPELYICERAITRNARKSLNVKGAGDCFTCGMRTIKKEVPNDCFWCKAIARAKLCSQVLINSADKAFLRFQNTGLNLQKVTIHFSVSGFENREAFSGFEDREAFTVERWINFVTAYNLYELSLLFVALKNPVMPSTLLTNGKLLRALTLTYCKFEDDFAMDTSGTTMLPSLQKLSLSYVKLSDSVLDRLISCCPRVSELSLVNCKSLRTLCVDSFSKLKKVHLENTFRSKIFGFERILIKSQQLECFIFKHFGCKKKCKIDIGSGKTSLKELEISCWHLPKSIVREAQVSFSNFARLKILSLHYCHPLLESINLSRLKYLRDASIFAPSLPNTKFDNPSTGILFGSFISRDLQKTTFSFANVSMTCWIKKIRSLLWALHNEKEVSFHFPVMDVGKFQHKEFHVNPKLQECRVHHLNLKFEADCNFKDIVDALFNTCCINVLTLTWCPTNSELGQKLLQLGMPRKISECHFENITCCIDSKVRCWRHYVFDYREIKGDSCTREVKLMITLDWPLYSKKRKYIEEAMILAGPKIPGQCYVYDCLDLPCL